MFGQGGARISVDSRLLVGYFNGNENIVGRSHVSIGMTTGYSVKHRRRQNYGAGWAQPRSQPVSTQLASNR